MIKKYKLSENDCEYIYALIDERIQDLKYQLDRRDISDELRAMLEPEYKRYKELLTSFLNSLLEVKID